MQDDKSFQGLSKYVIIFLKMNYSINKSFKTYRKGTKNELRKGDKLISSVAINRSHQKSKKLEISLFVLGSSWDSEDEDIFTVLGIFFQ